MTIFASTDRIAISLQNNKFQHGIEDIYFLIILYGETKTFLCFLLINVGKYYRQVKSDRTFLLPPVYSTIFFAYIYMVF